MRAAAWLVLPPKQTIFRVLEEFADLWNMNPPNPGVAHLRHGSLLAVIHRSNTSAWKAEEIGRC